jgi:two-component system, OmpR family, response regulator MprA
VLVLVVDDNVALRATLARALAAKGYEVALAQDGAEALRIIARSAPAAIVLDVRMSGMDGMEVCRRLRAAGDRTPVLMLSGLDHVDDRIAGLEAGADDYLVKPFVLDELVARLRSVIRRYEISRVRTDLSVSVGESPPARTAG